MFNVILLSLAAIVSSAPGSGGITWLSLAIPPPLVAPQSLALLQSASPHGLPSHAAREETHLSTAEEKEESESFLLGGTACACDRISAIGGQEGAIVEPVPAHDFLHQLHHSWQLLR